MDDTLPALSDLQALFDQLLAAVETNFAAGHLAPQVGAILAAYGSARLISRRLRPHLRHVQAKLAAVLPGAAARFRPLQFACIWLLLQWFALVALREAGLPVPAVQGAVTLLVAWVVVRLASSLIASLFWSRTIAAIVVAAAALKVIGLWAPTVHVLDEMAITIGTVRISVLGAIEATLIMAVLWGIAAVIGRWLDRWAERLPDFSPSGRVLLGKTFRFCALSVATIIALHAIGVDLTTLAVFSGAIGLGIGFGLQRVFANLISGMILLLDRSVKPGDVIAVDGHYGWINALGARYVSVVTRDGIEHLIPNEDLISTRVENWSHSNNLLRLHVAFGIAYGSDLHRAVELAEQAACAVPRVLHDPQPRCLLIEFADSTIKLDLRLWINDPRNGVHNVKSEVLMRICDAFRQAGIELPYPQRDLHLKTAALLPVRLMRGPESPSERNPKAARANPAPREIG